jgi:hypothetical protein
MVDDLAIVKSVHTEAINHDPAITYICTGSQFPGRPSLGAWLSYGLGTLNQNLPAFVVMTPPGPAAKRRRRCTTACGAPASCRQQAPGRRAAQPGRPGAVPVQPARRDRGQTRRRCSIRWAAEPADVRRASAIRRPRPASPSTRWPSACRRRCPTDRHLRRAAARARHVRPDVTEARHLRRQLPAGPPMAERDVRFVQIFHRGWDQHANLAGDLPNAVPRRRPALCWALIRTSSSAACSTTRWSSGAASSAARSTARAR